MTTLGAVLIRNLPTVPPFLVGTAMSAACHGEDPDLWFPERGGSLYTRARQICSTCPLRDACAEWAVESDQEFGMWGGLTPDELALRRAQRRGATS